MNDLDSAVNYYKEVIKFDATNVEAIACIATHYFYSEQPEMALRFYRYVYMHVCTSKVERSEVMHIMHTYTSTLNSRKI